MGKGTSNHSVLFLTTGLEYWGGSLYYLYNSSVNLKLLENKKVFKKKCTPHIYIHIHAHTHTHTHISLKEENILAGPSSTYL